MTKNMRYPASELSKAERLARALDQVQSGNRPFNMQLAAQIKHELRRLDGIETKLGDPVRDAEIAAWAIWKAEAAEGTPKSLYDARTIDAFRSGLNPDDRERLIRKGRAVVSALVQKGEQ